MRLSEAIRLGSMLKPQNYRGLWSEDGSRTCAFGAAWEAIGFTVDDQLCGEVARGRWPVVDVLATCPVGCRLPAGWTVSSVVPHLNDRHQWTRERIADWVETIELQHTPPAEVLEAVTDGADLAAALK